MTITVMIVDDSKLARIVAGKKLSALQPEWERVEAANSDQAMELAAAQPIDVALVDFNMPGKNGIELAEELRQTYPQMSIAITSANIQDEIILRARAIQAAFVAKPLTEEALSGFIGGVALRLRAGIKK